MEQRKKLIWGIVGAIGIIVILVLVAVLIDNNNSEENPTNTDTANQPQLDENGQPIRNIQQPAQQDVPAVPTSPELYVRQLSRIFVERFGSYSNQNNNQHIKDVDPLLTPTMRRWVQSQNQQQSNDYEGQTTKLISSSVTSFIQEASAEVQIGVQQEKTIGNSTETVYRDGRVELLYQNGKWLIDGLYFE